MPGRKSLHMSFLMCLSLSWHMITGGLMLCALKRVLLCPMSSNSLQLLSPAAVSCEPLEKWVILLYCQPRPQRTGSPFSKSSLLVFFFEFSSTVWDEEQIPQSCSVHKCSLRVELRLRWGFSSWTNQLGILHFITAGFPLSFIVPLSKKTLSWEKLRGGFCA